MSETPPPNFPMSSFMPFFWPQGSTQPDHRNEVPARVRVALSFLGDLSVKTMQRIAVNDISIEQFDGAKLVADEVMAQSAALDLLANYFRGDYQWDSFEAHDRQEEKQEGEGTIIRCPACMDNPLHRSSCTLCRGNGVVMIHRTTKRE